jgi:membrane associated rhomboid family serine protease
MTVTPTTSAGLRARAGGVDLRRFPLLTLAVLVATAGMSLAQAADGDLLGSLERTHAELHGEEWRIVTALFVQDGGVLGAVSNLFFVAVVGAVAEQVLSRPRWLVQYLGVGLLTELVAYAWQPVGGGNSIAVCGLAGAVAVASWREDPRLPALSAPVLLLWCGALLGTEVPALVAVGVVAAGLAVRQERHARVDRPTAVAVAATGLVLAAATNIHGAALLLGIVLALVDAAGSRRLGRAC